jgi:gliding motility-associated transport system ATP-binding protein
MIAVKNLVKSFGNTRAVDDVSFTIERGEIVGMLGPNGAGKTTTMRMITTYLPPDSGDAVIDGKSILNEPIDVRRGLGYLPESAPLYSEMTIEPFLNYMGQIRQIGPDERRRRIGQMIDECGLKEVLDREIGQLSKGYRQRVGLAATLLHDPDLLILDEPTSGLDPNQIVEIRGLIKRIAEKKTIILSTHILPEVEATCGRMIIIAFGKIVADGSAATLLAAKSGGAVFTVGVKGDAAKAKAALAAAPFVASVEPQPAGGGANRFEVATRGDGGGERIFEFAVQKGLVLTELTARRESLEDVFAQLTRAGEQ